MQFCELHSPFYKEAALGNLFGFSFVTLFSLFRVGLLKNHFFTVLCEKHFSSNGNIYFSEAPVISNVKTNFAAFMVNCIL